MIEEMYEGSEDPLALVRQITTLKALMERPCRGLVAPTSLTFDEVRRVWQIDELALEQPLSWRHEPHPQAIAVGLEVCVAAAEAQARGLALCGLSPETVFADGPQGVLVQIPASPPLKFSPIGAETMLIVDPQIGPIDTTNAVWNLGYILHRLLTGKDPWNAPNSIRILLAIKEGKLERADEQVRAVPAALADLVRRCIDPDREKRPPDAASVARALLPFYGRDDELARAAAALPPALPEAVDWAEVLALAERNFHHDGPKRSRLHLYHLTEARRCRVAQLHRDGLHAEALALIGAALADDPSDELRDIHAALLRATGAPAAAPPAAKSEPPEPAPESHARKSIREINQIWINDPEASMSDFWGDIGHHLRLSPVALVFGTLHEDLSQMILPMMLRNLQKGTRKNLGRERWPEDVWAAVEAWRLAGCPLEMNLDDSDRCRPRRNEYGFFVRHEATGKSGWVELPYVGLPDEFLLIGSDERCSLVLTGEGIAPQHARYYGRGHHRMIFPLVEGVRCGDCALNAQEEMRIDGETFQIGGYTIRHDQIPVPQESGENLPFSRGLCPAHGFPVAPMALRDPADAPTDDELRRASDPSTPPGELQELASRGHPALLARVAANASTPAPALRSLAERCPEALDPHAEPALLSDCFPWDALKSGAIHQAEFQLFGSLLSHPSCPEDLIEAVLRSQKVRSQAALRQDGRAPYVLSVRSVERWPARLLAEAAEFPSEGLRRLVAACPRTPPEALLRLLGDEALSVRLAATANPSLPVSGALALAHSDKPERRALAAGCPQLPGDLVERLSIDRDARVREAAARNPALPEPILHKLARDPASAVRLAAASHHAIAPDLARDIVLRHARSWRVPMDSLVPLLDNPALPDDSRLWLARRHHDLRPRLAACPLAGAALEWLAEREPALRGDIARNPSAPRALLERLVLSMDPGAALAAFRQLHASERAPS